MFEHWKLKDFAPGEGLASGVLSMDLDGWIDVDVPGDVHQALIAAGRIPDPYDDKNELACAWMEAREWWYSTTFPAPAALLPDERLTLVFQGLDTFATIYLNGNELGRSANMFHELVFDLTNTALAGQENALAVCFQPPAKAIEGKTPPLIGPIGADTDMSKVLMRKAQLGYGWDWGPRLPTIGIWRPVALRCQRTAAIQSVHFTTEALTSENARAAVRVEVDHFAGRAPLKLQISLKDAQGKTTMQRTVPVRGAGGRANGQALLTIDNPHWWWTHDLGEPYLYTLEVILEQAGAVLDRQTQPAGIRTIALDQSPDPDEPGTRFFRFVLNGVPIFAKGADWIPADSFVGAIPAEQYERWIRAAVDANMSMLRVWGGGIYESDVFFDLCDRLGVLVWQDFMFACAAYPQDDPAFVEEVRQEAVYQIKRLRSHPCLAAWVGNNECQVMADIGHLIYGEIPPLPGALYYEEMLPELVKTLDGQVPYWPGSPYGGRFANDQAAGDVHDWTVWHGMSEDADFVTLLTKGPTPKQVAYTRYAEDQGRFISEFGMHASPVLETLRRVIPADQLYHHSPSMDHHNKDNPKNKGDLLMMTSTGLPRDLAEYVDFSMIAQAEGLKFGIEHFRRRKPHCSGTLIWQLNDCWPVLSWAIMDYYGFGKAGYFYTRRVYAPLLASFKPLADGSVELWLTNDTLAPFSGPVTIQYGDFAAGKLWEETVNVQVAANASQSVWLCATDLIKASPDRYLAVRSLDGAFPANRHFFAAIKDLERGPVEPAVKVTAVSEHALRVNVKAPAYVYYFHILCSDERTHYSDNYFDLAAGETAVITVTLPAGALKPEMLSFGWR